MGKMPGWAQAQFGLRDEMRAWIGEARARQKEQEFYLHHDEGSFMYSWLPMYLLEGDEEVLEFMLEFAREYLGRLKELGEFYHGYWREEEVHHGTEAFIQFLIPLAGVMGEDWLMEALEDACEHIGNFAQGVREWYDWEGGRFRSWMLGTEKVLEDPPFDIQTPDHFRLVEMALGVYRLTGKVQYLEVAREYGKGWAEFILEKGVYPVIAPEGRREYEEVIRIQPEREDMRAEPFVAGFAVDGLCDLYKLTGEGIFADAARRVIEAILPSLKDGMCEVTGYLVGKYRAFTGDDGFDREILEAVEEQSKWDLPEALIIADVPDRSEKIFGRVIVASNVGRRFDEVRWGVFRENGKVDEIETPSSSLLALGYIVAGDEGLAEKAFALAGRKIRLARFALRDGRENGCAGRSIAAVASGHGRACGVGVVTGVLGPLCLGSYRLGMTEEGVKVEGAGGDVALIRKGGKILLYNRGEIKRIGIEKEGRKIELEIGKDELKMLEVENLWDWEG